ncbi:MAG TPA: tetratricopeptide repeat-containing glycosyltransferase family protein [Granulicella sp.]|nr:tetratricopeptide repeat-containing glycosyltransferase family protein [Granulicella sp.]
MSRISDPPSQRSQQSSAVIPRLLTEALSHHQAGRLPDAERLYRQILALDPRHPDGLHLLGVLAHQTGHHEAAVDTIRQAIANNSRQPSFYSHLGLALQALGRMDEAATSYRQALTLNPNFAEAHNNLGNTQKALGDLEPAILSYERALVLHPGYVDAHSNLGLSLQLLGRFDEAAAQYERAIARNPEYAHARWNQALLQLLFGDFASGLRNYEWRWQSANKPRNLNRPQWHGEPLNGARILLDVEQGLGDTLQFLRYLPMVQAAGGSVVLGVPANLRRLVAELPGLAYLGGSGDPLPPFDWHCPLMSLPLAFGTTLETIPAQTPYLTVPADAQRKAAALPWPTDGLRVGIAWAGSPTHLGDRFRSIPLPLLEPLLHVEGANFFSLQLGPEAAQLAASQTPITDLAPAITDLADTAALMQQLDLVIAVDTAVVHLAGALNRPVWVMLPFSPDWRWLLDREDSPWYPSMRLFRQPRFGDWPAVVDAVRAALLAKLQTHGNSLPPGEIAPSPAIE